MLETLAALVVASILGATGLSKALSPKLFAERLSGTYGLPSNLAFPVAILVPTIEFIGCALLLLPQERLAGFMLASVTLVSLALASTVALVQGRSGDCGCYGTLASTPLSRSTPLRALAVLSIAIVGASSNVVVAEGEQRAVWLPLAAVLLAAGLVALAVVIHAAIGLRRAVGQHDGHLHR